MTTDLRPWCLRDLPDGRLCELHERDGDCWAAPVEEIPVIEAADISAAMMRRAPVDPDPDWL